MLTGWLAICGIPIFAGFFSKDEILWKTWSASGFSLPSPTFSKVLWGIGALTALLTAVYMTRMMVMTFWGNERFRQPHSDSHDAHAHDNHGPVEPHESPWSMTIPLIVLAVLSTFGGFIGVRYALVGKDIIFTEPPRPPVVAEIPANGEHRPAQPELQLLSPPPQQTDSASPIHPLSESATASHETHSAEELLAE